MKKLELTAVANFLRTLPEDTTFPNPAYNGENTIRPAFPIKEIIEMMDTELHRNDRVKAEKEAAYTAAKPAVLEALRIAGKPATVAEIFAECEKELPDGFTKNQVGYGLTHYWTDSVVKIEGKVNTYQLKEGV